MLVYEYLQNMLNYLRLWVFFNFDITEIPFFTMFVLIYGHLIFYYVCLTKKCRFSTSEGTALKDLPRKIFFLRKLTLFAHPSPNNTIPVKITLLFKSVFSCSTLFFAQYWLAISFNDDFQLRVLELRAQNNQGKYS